jgi:hypothetical protein
MAVSLAPPTGSKLSIAMATDLDVRSLGFAIGQIYNPPTRRAVDVGTRMSGTVAR